MPRLISYACLAFWLAAGRVAGQEYDYVVVGSGPGGGPLAVDLAKSGSSVLLLEAGPDLLDDPAHYAATYGDIGAAPAAVNSPNSRWDFFVKHSDDPARELRYRRTTWRAPDGSLHVRGGGGPDDGDDDDDDPPEEGARPLGIWYPRASALGGGAMTGDAVLELPPDDTWDRIADATGDRSWAADEMRNIYAEIEAAHYVPNGTRGHGFAGWLETNRAGDAWVGEDAEATAMLRAMLGRLPGAPANVSADDDDLRAQLRRDINAPRGDENDDDGGATTTTGVFGVVAHADARGRRSSPAHYIRRALAEDPDLPLFVEANATVTGIVWDPLSSGGPPAVMAVNYVVGPGAYGADPRHGNDDAATPAFTYVAKELILAAGVFNSPQILMASGVGPARALRALGIPVVADVPGVGANLGDVYEGSVASVAGLSGFSSSSLSSSSSSRSGSIGSYSVQMRTSVSDGGADVVLWPAPYGFDGYWPGYLTHDDEDDDDKANTSSSTIAFALKSPHSARGTVTLRSADPLDPPEVNFRFFEDGAERDLQALLEALEVAGGLPSLSSSSSSSVEEAKEALKTQAYSRSATGTCALGDTAADPMAVVDAAFRVRGVDRLRVVDASVFPRPPGAFPALATYMISRKAARVILEDGWRWG